MIWIDECYYKRHEVATSRFVSTKFDWVSNVSSISDYHDRVWSSLTNCLHFSKIFISFYQTKSVFISPMNFFSGFSSNSYERHNQSGTEFSVNDFYWIFGSLIHWWRSVHHSNRVIDWRWAIWSDFIDEGRLDGLFNHATVGSIAISLWGIWQLAPIPPSLPRTIFLMAPPPGSDVPNSNDRFNRVCDEFYGFFRRVRSFFFTEFRRTAWADGVKPGITTL